MTAFLDNVQLFLIIQNTLLWYKQMHNFRWKS